MTKDLTRDVQPESFSAGDGMEPGFPGPVSLRGDQLDPSVLNALFDASLSPDRTACRIVLAQALDAGMDPTALADLYIPAVAEVMGDMWCKDTLGFAEVTIGVARLQSMLRDLGPEWRADDRAAADAPLILLISPRDAQHTLGAVLLGGQLRRRGYSVRIALDPTNEALGKLVQRLHFDAIFVSASESESLEKLRRMLDFLRKESQGSVPIAVGGGVLETNEDVAALIGADIATSHIDEAIEHCGLKITHNSTHASRT